MRNSALHDVYSNPEYYDALNNFQDDIIFYSNQIRKGDKVLELASGTGRISIQLAKMDCEVTGIDTSLSFITCAEKKSKGLNNISFHHASMINFSFKEKFDLIILPFNSICHLYDFDSINKCFECVKEHLKPNGNFIIDVFVPNNNLLYRNKKELFKLPDYYLEDGEKVIHSESNIYDVVTQINHIKWFIEVGTKKDQFDLKMRMFYPDEINNYLLFSGFKINEKFGDFRLNPFKNTSCKQVIVSSILK